MAVLVSDTFDRANSTSVVGAGSVGPAPTSLVGTWGISANQLYASAVVSSRAFIAWDVGTPNVDIVLTRTAGSLNVGGFIFGAVSATDCYMMNWNGTSLGVGRWIGTAFVAYAGLYVPPGYALGQELRVVHNAGVVEAFVAGATIGRVTLPQVPSGTLAGVYTSTTAERWNDLGISDSAPINMEYDGFTYKGRDTATLDSGADA